jgi:transposase
MWTDETRLRHDRSGLRYTHDLTDEEWAQVEPLIPPAKPGGNKRTVDIREIVNGLMYILGSGRQWRDIPKDLRWSRKFGQEVKLGSILRRTDLHDRQTEEVFGGLQGEGCS